MLGEADNVFLCLFVSLLFSLLKAENYDQKLM